jgi:monoamine oxidase
MQEAALEQGSRIHPQYRAEFERAFFVAWRRVPWNRGSWSTFLWNSDPIPIEPDGRVYLAGDHVSHVRGARVGTVRRDENPHARVDNRPRSRLTGQHHGYSVGTAFLKD